MKHYLLCLALLAACAKNETEQPAQPEPDAGGLRGIARPPLVPSDEKGWPIGWPRKGVVFLRRDGGVEDYLGGPDGEDPEHAERWDSASLTDEQLKMINQAARIDVRGRVIQ